MEDKQHRRPAPKFSGRLLQQHSCSKRKRCKRKRPLRNGPQW
ncbi:hypothetical protein AWB74_04263 [Caballeronia arvi]|uniref:Uncharacterized protein n=1 Tax=Caballeronia arvi TaxID=1777135 RepID=A0A158JSR4_9BURK|nr:hypothetical protein AWB74_04263 [Caballeronia arvi]